MSKNKFGVLSTVIGISILLYGCDSTTTVLPQNATNSPASVVPPTASDSTAAADALNFTNLQLGSAEPEIVPIVDSSGAVLNQLLPVSTSTAICSEFQLIEIISARTPDPHDSRYGPSNTIDNDLGLESRWSALGKGRSITFELENVLLIDTLQAAWYKANIRTAFFDVYTSWNGVDWQNVLPDAIAQGTQDLITFDLKPSLARFVKVVGQGNSLSLWNSILEVKIPKCIPTFAPETPTAPQTPIPPSIPPNPEIIPLTTKMIVGQYAVIGGNKDFQVGRFQFNGANGAKLRWIDEIGNSWLVDFKPLTERLHKQPDELDPNLMTYNLMRGVDPQTGGETNEIIGFELDGVVFDRISSDGGAFFDPADTVIGDTNLDSLVQRSGGAQAFNEKTLFILESFLKAEELYFAGKYDKAQILVDAVWDAYPPGAGWGNQLVPAHLRLGTPQSYTAMLMLTEALRYRQTYGAHEPSAKMTHTFVEAACMEGIIPTTTAEHEANEGVFERRFLSDKINKKLYQQSFRLFGEFVESITNGALEYEIDVIRLPEDMCFEGSVSGNFAGRINASSVIREIEESNFHQSDIYAVVYPNFAPDADGNVDRKTFITGGVGSINRKPVWIADDSWFLNKPYNFDGGAEWEDIDRRVYMPHWVNHEFFHAMFKTYFREFELEATGHQWFDRSKWPSDFVGSYEPDYFFQAIERRFRSAVPSIGARLQKGTPPAEELEYLTPEVLIGTYERVNPTNNWHTGDITVTDDNKVTWLNRANIRWTYDLNKSLGVLQAEGLLEIQIRFGYDDTTGASIPGHILGLMINGEPYDKIQ